MADNPLAEWVPLSDFAAQGLARWRIERALQLAQGLPVHFAWFVGHTLPLRRRFCNFFPDFSQYR
jgi:hypothetical protein